MMSDITELDDGDVIAEKMGKEFAGDGSPVKFDAVIIEGAPYLGLEDGAQPDDWPIMIRDLG